MTAIQTLEELVSLGGFWAGDAGPAVPVVLAKSSGGYFDGTGCLITGFVRRWDPRRLVPVGKIVLDGTLTAVDPPNGRYLFDWIQTSLGTVPFDTGLYVLQLDILPPTGQEQLSQRALFTVLPSMPRPV